ncbi:hypothetical protein GGI43DRAFT_391026 [Trichoderma evansii]
MLLRSMILRCQASRLPGFIHPLWCSEAVTASSSTTLCSCPMLKRSLLLQSPISFRRNDTVEEMAFISVGCFAKLQHDSEGHEIRLDMTGPLYVDEWAMLQRRIQEMLSQHSSYRHFSHLATIAGVLRNTRIVSNKVPLFGSDAHRDSVKRRCDAVIAADGLCFISAVLLTLYPRRLIAPEVVW